jgi:hypothetical protein
VDRQDLSRPPRRGTGFNLGAGGRRFESGHPDQLRAHVDLVPGLPGSQSGSQAALGRLVSQVLWVLATAGIAALGMLIVDGTSGVAPRRSGRTRRCRSAKFPGGEAKRVPGRVREHQAVVVIRLEVEPDRAGPQYALFRRLQVVHEEVDVQQGRSLFARP